MITVVVPIYNVAPYLRQCVDSILHQKYEDIEIILVDDGSTDQSGEICDEYAKADMRVKVLHKKNEGLVRARKDGLSIAHGEWVAYVDGDDWIEDTMLEKMCLAAVDEQVDVVICGKYMDMEEKSTIVQQAFKAGRYDRTRLEREIYPNMIMNKHFFEWGISPNLWDKLYKRELLFEHQMAVDDILTMGEDAACVYPYLCKAQSMYILNEPLYHYRQLNTSMMKRKRDVAVERRNYSVLYRTGEKAFGDAMDPYNFRGQWLGYLLFMMVPRASLLYEGVEELQYLFPFPEVMKGDRVLIYCAGTFGQWLYSYLTESGFCTVVAIADQNYEEIRKQGIPVIAPEEMNEYDFNAIIVANSFYKTSRKIQDVLSKRFPQKRVCVFEENTIFSESTLKAFHLSV